MQETQEMQVQSLGQEDMLATHSSILIQENPMDRGSWWATVKAIAESNMT